jgi:hypothetical protein
LYHSFLFNKNLSCEVKSEIYNKKTSSLLKRDEEYSPLFHPNCIKCNPAQYANPVAYNGACRHALFQSSVYKLFVSGTRSRVVFGKQVQKRFQPEAFISELQEKSAYYPYLHFN